MQSLMKNGSNLKVMFRHCQFCCLYFRQPVRIASCKMKKNKIRISNLWIAARIIKKLGGCLNCRNGPTIALGEV